MKFFLDTADLAAVQQWAPSGLIDGVTTNPSLIAKANRPREAVVEEICQLILGPVSIEVLATESKAMVAEAEPFLKIAPNITIKLPLTGEGLRACRTLSDRNVKTNVTLCFTPIQALLAAKAGATFVSPFIGRLDDIGQDGIAMVADIKTIFSHYPHLKTEILVASVRHPFHVLEAARLGADVVTLPAEVLEKLFKHPLTDQGIDIFIKDSQKK